MYYIVSVSECNSTLLSLSLYIYIYHHYYILCTLQYIILKCIYIGTLLKKKNVTRFVDRM